MEKKAENAMKRYDKIGERQDEGAKNANMRGKKH